MTDTLTGCLRGSILISFLQGSGEKEIKDNFLIFLGDEDFWCEKGGLGISSEFLPVGTVCNPVFLHISEGCTSAYTKLFNSSTTSNERLCSEYQKAKKCFLHAMFQHCSFSRMLLHVLEIFVEITTDFQPFCKTNGKQELLKFQDLFRERTCPPHSLSDVAFLLDVANGTTRTQYVSMKRTIAGLLKAMDFGWNGINIALYQFDIQLRAAVKFGRASSKTSFLRLLKRMRRTTTTSKNKAKRMTGRSLSSLARNTFSPDKQGDVLMKKPTKSGHRPYNAAIAFVFTTGASNDSMRSGLMQLKDRNVHVTFAGPSTIKVPEFTSKQAGGLDHKVISTNFRMDQAKKLVPELIKEICLAEKTRQKQDAARLGEGQLEKSKWSDIQTYFSRLGRYDLSLLFELKPFLRPSQEPTTSNEYDGFNELVGLPSEYVDGMDGDINYLENVNTENGGSNIRSTTNISERWSDFSLEENFEFGEFGYV